MNRSYNYATFVNLLIHESDKEADRQHKERLIAENRLSIEDYDKEAEFMHADRQMIE